MISPTSEPVIEDRVNSVAAVVDGRLSDRDERFLKNMALACAAAACLITLLVVGSYAIQSQRIESEAANSLVVAASGTERMLSQRVTLLSLSLLSTSDAGLRDRIRSTLKQAVETMERNHRGLIHGNAEMHLPQEMSEAVRQIYFEPPQLLDARIQRFMREVRKLSDAPESELTLDNAQLRYITSASTDLLNDLGTLTEIYSEEGKQGIHGLQRTVGVLVGITVFLIFIVATLVFQPMLRRLRGELRLRSETEEELTEAADKLEHYTQALEASNKELEQFANIVAHDLRAPLRTVMGFTDCLKDKVAMLNDSEADEYVTYVHTGAKRMDRLIADLLAFSRITSSEFSLEQVALDEVLEEILLDLASEIESKNAVVETVPLPWVMGNRTQLRQLFQNLIQNALKFSHKEFAPVVRIELVDDNVGIAEGYVGISVSDNGIGFKQEQGERIFQIFRRLHSEKEYEGSGVGLAICQKIIKKHGGSISAQGTPGKGARFNVVLQRAEPEL